MTTSRPNVATAPFTQTTLCPLGPSVVSPIASLNKYFRDEIEQRLASRRRGCPRDDDANPSQKTTVTVTIDGVAVEAKPGELLIKVAQEHGVYIPRFCWHERMKPVGMCRMCLVEVEGARGFPPACTTPVTDGMVCHTQTDTVKKIQDGVLEFLLINHPLDCPVCDRGGECPLQDQTLAFGPGESRFVEEKRHFEKPIRLSKLVLLDRERCIQCARCTRFADEIAGDPLIDFVDRSERTQVLNFAEQPFDSYFSGNTVQICPVGALTASQYRFQRAAVGPRRPRRRRAPRARCSAGARCSRRRTGWCGCSVSTRSRSTTAGCATRAATASSGCTPSGASSSRTSGATASRTRSRGRRRSTRPPPRSSGYAISHGPGAIAVLGGARGTNEDAYAWASTREGCDRHRQRRRPARRRPSCRSRARCSRAPRSPTATRAAAIVLLGPNLQEELPVLFLRVNAPRSSSASRSSISRRSTTRLTRARNRVRTPRCPARASADARADQPCARGERPGPVVVVLGRTSLAESPTRRSGRRPRSAELPDVRFLSALRRGNVHGALDAGLAPGFLPGRVTLDAGREWFA